MHIRMIKTIIYLKKLSYHMHVKKVGGFLKSHKLAIAFTTLIGTTVGAGILAIPYVAAQSGFLIGFLVIMLIGLAVILLNLFVGEIVLRTKEQHQLIGYIGKYLGKWGKRIMAFSLLLGLYGALTAYLIGEGEALKAIFRWGSPLFYSLIFFAIGSVIIYRGIKAAGEVDLVLVFFVFIVIILIGIFSYDKINISNLTTIDAAKFFVPYGVIFFALMGYSAVPQMQEELENEKHKMKKAILIGSIVPMVLYIVFTFVVVGIVGLENFQVLEPNQRIATVALSFYSSPILGVFANIFAVLAMFTSFLTLGVALVETYQYDYLFSHTKALLLTFSIPLLIVLFSLSSFITVIAVTGAIAGGLEGILITLAYWKARRIGERKPEYSLKYNHKILGTVLIAMFCCGILYQIYVNFF